MRYEDWLPRPEKRAPPWADRATATLDRRFQLWAVVMVLGIFVAVACLFTGQVVAMIIGLLIGAGGVLGAFLPERRLRAARRTGWRKAEVTISLKPGEDKYALIAVRFADGSRIDLWSRPGSMTVPALAQPPGLPALVAGYGPAMSVLVLPNPPFREKPVLFGARAETYRWVPKD
ncbi:hypothetical protein M8542_35640 [Amycolatopsis sp. OK19-0408]|uniref:Uncharacterized protein n=1 Tax=Amycolatopsis iheyensis TaxID=2945988 RepID=A0A9X2NNE9_9PSEU|nr:hypothetical protein [Amycolatopsis iheyensis]MCR6488175.1 hypothetical protein [Amycolatopsis iheyensis]